MQIEARVYDRLIIQEILPEMGSFSERMARQRLIRDLALTDEEKQEINLRQVFALVDSKGQVMTRQAVRAVGGDEEAQEMQERCQREGLEPKPMQMLWQEAEPLAYELSEAQVGVLKNALTWLDEPTDRDSTERPLDKFSDHILPFLEQIQDLEVD